MVVFLILAGFVALILYRQIANAFLANPGLNSLIMGVLALGIVLGLRQVVRLFPEIKWVNALRRDESLGLREPVLLAPMARMLGDSGLRAISTSTLRAILDSIGTRLDESREILRYMIGLLVFLGLLGTFWGLLETVGSIGGVIKSMQTGADATVMFDDLKNGLAAPISGMSIAFTSSLFGLAGSLILGFLDLQAGQAQNRFYTELEDALSTNATDSSILPATGGPMSPDFRQALQKLAEAADPMTARAATQAMVNLAEGIQGLVQHMRGEQQMLRTWVEAQADQQAEIRKLLQRLAAETERR
ncbi:MAG: conserved rane protein of unknown function [Hyphomicrobiales bacterium]|nr:conserved rane protein of unknown function [Hyphomicrobiales bacterium]